MTAADQRTSPRERILLLAQLRVEGEAEIYAVRIRDLSASGMRAHFSGRPLDKRKVAIEIRNLGWVKGRVAWQGADTIGVRFAEPIDPDKARIAVTGAYQVPATGPDPTQRRL